MRLALPLFIVTMFTSVPLYAQQSHHDKGLRDAGADSSEWLDDCRDWSRYRDDERARHCEVRRSAVAATSAHVSVDAGQNGGIALVGGAGDSMIVVAKIATTAGDSDRAAAIARQLRIEITATSVRAEGPSLGDRENWTVSFDVTLPRGADVSAETHNGGVVLSGLSGKVEAHAVNGPIVVREMSGDVTGRTVNGPINARLDGAKWEGRGLDLQTTNGPVVLEIPASYSAHLETGTVNGPMQLDFPVTIQGRITKRLSLELGGGGATVRAVTTNGPVVVRKR